MTRRITVLLALLFGLALLLLPGSALTREAKPVKDMPVGIYKFILPLRGDTALWLIRFDLKEGKPYAAVIATAPKKATEKQGVPKATIEKVSVSDGLLHFKLMLPEGALDIEAKLHGDKKAPLLGSLGIGQNVAPIVLEPTELTTLEPPTPTGAEAVQAAMQRLATAGMQKAKPEEVKEWADTALKEAARYGPRYHRDVLFDLVDTLNDQKEYAKLALPYAQEAEKRVTDKDTGALRKKTLTLLATALENNGKADEAKAVKARADMIPAVAALPFAGRKGKSDRVVLVELFTGAQCPPCVAADLAFDALHETYKPTEVVRLEYHLHIPRPDALTNADSEARAKFYDDDIEGTPTILLNGKVGPAAGGGRDDAQAKYDEITAAINPLLEKAPKATLKASAKLKEGKVAIEVETETEEADENVKLRIVLVEEEVTYKGSNGIDKHHCVVRAFPNGVAGSAVVGKKGKTSVTTDLDEVRKTLTAYLDKSSEKKPFATPERPLELKKLRVVAFLQNDKTHEVLQAVQTEVE